MVPPMTKMDSQLMGTTATPSLGLESDATLLHDSFNIATSAVGTCLQIMTSNDHWWTPVGYNGSDV